MRVLCTRKIVDHCACCNGPIYEGKSAVYDEQSEQHFCDRRCFRNWADDHFDEVLDYYAKLNVTDVCL